MGQIRLGIKYKSTGSGSGSDPVTIEPATAGTLQSTSGHFTNPPFTGRIVPPGALFVEVYNAGMSSSGGVPGIVEIQPTGSSIFYLEVGQTWRMEATLDPVTNTFLYCPAILIFSNDSMVFYTTNRAL